MHHCAEVCCKCGLYPEDILILSCSHDICLKCGSKSYNEKYLQNMDIGKENVIICEICHSETQLDESSIWELEKIIKKTKIKNSSKHSSPCPLAKSKTFSLDKIISPSISPIKTNPIALTHSISYQNLPLKAEPPVKDIKLDHSPLILNPLSFVKSPNTQETFKIKSIPVEKISFSEITSNISYAGDYSDRLLQKNPIFCPQHPEEEISYFCFSCNTPGICPECIIHGVHKNHDVMTIKKACPKIKFQLTDYLAKAQGVINLSSADVLENKINLFHNQATNKIKQIFDDLKNILQKSENEILRGLQTIYTDYKKKVDSQTDYLKQYHENYQKVFEIISNFNNLISSDFLNAYCSNYQTIEHFKTTIPDKLDINIDDDFAFQLETYSKKEVQNSMNAIGQELSRIANNYVSKSGLLFPSNDKVLLNLDLNTSLFTKSPEFSKIYQL